MWISANTQRNLTHPLLGRHPPWPVYLSIRSPAYPRDSQKLHDEEREAVRHVGEFTPHRPAGHLARSKD
jgi:hypothetical protein